MTYILLITFFVLLVLDVPVVFCMLVSSLAALLYADVNPLMMALELSRNMNSLYPMVAVPFFILAGDLMNKGGLSQKVINLCQAMMGQMPGGLAMVTTNASMFFGAISGSSSATCAAIGGVMIPAMEKEGYERSFATALAACSGTTGALIPPSMVLLFYAAITGMSVEKIFMAGVIPGLLIGTGLIAVSFLYARKRNLKLKQTGEFLGHLFSSLKESVWAVILVCIIFFGILGIPGVTKGIFTATEASAVAVVYALFIGFFVYRQLKVRDLPKIFVGAAKTTASLTFLISASGLFGWVLSVAFLPEAITSGLLNGSKDLVAPFQHLLTDVQAFEVKKYAVLIALNIALLIIGMFLDAGPAIIILAPIVFPIGQQLGMDNYHFGVMVVTNLVIGLVTPPVGTTLFVASGVGNVKMASLIPYILKFLWVMILVQVLIIFVPVLTTWLPSFIK
ncbi:TRAP transporter large permease [Reichenbachiella sp. MALMAid0571]|uniref:TRAP transporter large permease n=1 Tax=Reichenbachiella sp. MALMAid0571 TaxID=3143939 RepID=UPI0032DFEAA5